MGVYTLQETIFRNARRAGLSEIGEVDISVLRHEGWVRKLCEENACRNYSTNWACPPAVGTLEECRERCRSFDHMLLFNKVYTLRDSYDLEGMYDSMRMFRHTVDRFDWRLAGRALPFPRPAAPFHRGLRLQHYEAGRTRRDRVQPRL